jgi:hypothetical protein
MNRFRCDSFVLILFADRRRAFSELSHYCLKEDAPCINYRSFNVVVGTAVVWSCCTLAFADPLWDSCHKLAQHRVGPVGQSTHRDEGFVLQCLAGKIPLPHSSINPTVATRAADGRDVRVIHLAIHCVESAINGQRYCY